MLLKNPKDILIELLKNELQFISGKLTRTFTFNEAHKQWTEVL